MSNAIFFATRTAARNAVTDGAKFKDMGKDAPNGERWAVVTEMTATDIDVELAALMMDHVEEVVEEAVVTNVVDEDVNTTTVTSLAELVDSAPTLRKAARRVANKAASGPSKKDTAIDIMRSMVGSARKDVIVRLMDEANLTKGGASTYYANFKNARDGWV